MASGVTTPCAWPGRDQSATELMPFMNFSVHLYTCCSDRHASPYWTFIGRWISMGFHPLNTLFFFGACCKQGGHLNSSTAPLYCIPAVYCHLSATLQTMNIIVVNLQDNRAVFQIFIALIRFSLDSPSYILCNVTLHTQFSYWISDYINTSHCAELFRCSKDNWTAPFHLFLCPYFVCKLLDY
jgi:hypothetical protein